MKYFDEVYNQYFKDVYCYVFSLSRSQSVAEEVTKETFFRALKKIDSFRGDCDIRIWLCQIAKNEYFRMRERGRRFTEEPPPDSASSQNTEEDFIKKEETLRIYRTLHDLDEPYKEVFSMRVFGELPYKELGLILGKSENWARVTYYRAKQRIQSRLKEGNHG